VLSRRHLAWETLPVLIHLQVRNFSELVRADLALPTLELIDWSWRILTRARTVALLINGEHVGDELLHAEFLRLSGGLPPGDPAISLQELQHLLHLTHEEIICRTLLCQMARGRHLHVTNAEVEAERRQRWGSSTNSVCGAGVQGALATELLVKRMRAELVKHVPRPKRAEVEQFYRANARSFHQPERVLASHIIKNVGRPEEEAGARASLEEARHMLEAGKPFAQVANGYSDCAGDGGQLGWIGRGAMVEEFDEVVFGLECGELSPIFATVFGLHLAIVRDRKPAGIQPLEEVRHELARTMFTQRQEQQLRYALFQIRKVSDIVEGPALDRSIASAEDIAR